MTDQTPSHTHWVSLSEYTLKNNSCLTAFQAQIEFPDRIRTRNGHYEIKAECRENHPRGRGYDYLSQPHPNQEGIHLP